MSSSVQLGIIVKARDEASVALKSVGDSAKDSAEKLNLLQGAAETGHGFHKMVRQARNIAIAFEVVPVGISAAQAAYAAFTGTAEESAEAQTKLLDAIREVPLVGKHAADAAQFLGDAVAHAFGKETTAQMQAEVDRQKAIMSDWASAALKLNADTQISQNRTALLGLAPGEKDIEEAKAKYKEAVDALAPEKAKMNAVFGLNPDDAAEQAEKLKKIIANVHGEGLKLSNAFTGSYADIFGESDKAIADAKKKLAQLTDSSVQSMKSRSAQIAKLEADAGIERDAAIRIGNAKVLADATALNDELAGLQRGQNEKLNSLADERRIAALQEDQSEYEARIATLKASLAREFDAIDDGARRKTEVLRREAAAQQLLADQGNAEAGRRAGALRGAAGELGVGAIRQKSAAGDIEAIKERSAIEQQLRETALSTLRAQGEAGSASAKLELDRLQIKKEQQSVESALLAIENDAFATENQRANAADALNASRKAAVDELSHKRDELLAGNAENVRDSALFVLQQEAALGDQVAEKQLKKIELEKDYAEQKKKLLTVMAAESGANDAQRDAARKALGALDQVEAKALQKLGQGEQRSTQLAGLEISQYLTGVSASAGQEKDANQPLIDATKDSAASVVDAINAMMEMMKDIEREKAFRRGNREELT